MKKIALLLFFLSVSFSSLLAQYAVVVDEGGFVNIYDDEKEELDRLGSEGIVAIMAEEGEQWAKVDYTKYGLYAASSGFVKKEKLIDITSFPEIKIIEEAENTIVLGNDSISIKLGTKAFIESDNVISHFSEENDEVITAINEDPFWGTKTGLPDTQYAAIAIKKGEHEIEFPAEALFNLYNPHLSLTKAYYNAKDDVLYICAANGDISGAYTVIWVVEFNEYSIHYIFD